MRRLCIISHTAHYINEKGVIVGLNSTVTEINHLLGVFDEIIHIAMLHNVPAPLNAIPYESKRISFRPIPALGGPGLYDKLQLIFKAPKILNIISKSLDETEFFQFRAPTGIGIYVIPYLMFFKQSKKGWFKYAGNWKQKNAPLFYRIQKWMLLNEKRKITINGKWKNQKEQCLSFENPCISEQELLSGKKVRSSKIFDQPKEICFVGRLEREKGLDLLIDTLANLSIKNLKKIGTLHIVGKGVNHDHYRTKLKDIEVNFKLYGLLSRKEVQAVYEKSHTIILPSKSEGFPKVISEALNFGCLPIVSDVSSIGQYVKDGKHGFLIKSLNVKELENAIIRFLNLNQKEYQQMIDFPDYFIERFSYDYYNAKIIKTILGD